MVSIPCSQIKHIIYFDPTTEKNNCKKAKYLPSSKSIIKEAENKGYFKTLTAEYLNETFNNEEIQMQFADLGARDTLKFIKAVNLHHLNVQRLDCLKYCRNLAYVNLSTNFISDFSSLKSCNQLICLDLSANLIESLPDFTFWNNFVSLKFLYLHDNPIANPDSVLGLSSCPKLTILTLWDTPLALRRKYRHFIVNSIWSLKVLDHHFVSDEEIIEDADFRNSHFRSMDNLMKVASYRLYDHLDMTAIENDFHQIIVEINRLASHLSPVLVIQRWIRGFLSRKRYKYIRVMKHGQTIILPNLQKSPESTVIKETENEEDGKYLKIDLVHLSKISTLENLDKEAVLRNFISSTAEMLTFRSTTRLDNDTCSPEHISRALDNSKGLMNDSTLFNTDIEGQTEFRFKVTKPPTTSKCPSKEIMAEKHRYHNFTRESDKIYHDKLLLQFPEIKSRPVKKTNSDFLFRKSQGCMGLFLLNKWDKADRELQEMERFQDKINNVQMVKNDRDLNQVKLNEGRLKRLAVIKSKHYEHKDSVERAIENEKEHAKKNEEELKVKNCKSKERKSKILSEMAFSLDFRSKQTAACKAVNSFEQLTNKDEQLQLNRCSIGEMRDKMKLEMETVKAYLENQSLNKRAEKRLENTALDLQLLQQTNNRMHDSKMRVEKLKSIRRLVSCPHLPVIQLNVVSMPT